MASLQLDSRPPLDCYARRFGDTQLREVSDWATFSLAIPKDGEQAFADRIKAQHGLDLPEPGKASQAGEARLIWMGPDQFLWLGPFEALNPKEFEGAAYLTEQTHALAMLEASGPLARSALELLVPLDLNAFGEDSAARTLAEHLALVLVGTGFQTYLLVSASSSAKSFLHAVETAFLNVA